MTFMLYEELAAFFKVLGEKNTTIPVYSCFQFYEKQALREIKSIPVEGMMMIKASTATVTGLSSL